MTDDEIRATMGPRLRAEGLSRLALTLEPTLRGIGAVLATQDAMSLTRAQFVGQVMRASRGFADPEKAACIYDRMFDEAFGPIHKLRRELGDPE